MPTEEELGAAQFTDVRSPRTLDETDLRRCAAPTGNPSAGVPIFAVAARDGVVTNTATEYEYEATAVLYATVDGEHVAEYHIAGGLPAAPRARVVESVDDLDVADDAAQSHAREALGEHPELDGVEEDA